MNDHRAPGGGRPGVTAGMRGPEQRAATWAIALLWVGAIGGGLLLMPEDDSRELAPADRRGLASRDLVSTRTRYGGWSGGSRQPGSSARGRRPDPRLAYTYQQVLRVGDPAVRGGLIGENLEIHGLNDAAQAAIVSNDPGGEALFLVAPGRVKSIVRPGRRGPEGSRFGGAIYMPEAMNNRGQVVWSGSVEGGETWSFLHDARTGQTEVVHRPGTPAPGGGVFAPGERQCPEINNRGEVAFHGSIAYGRRGRPMPGVFARYPERTLLVAREGSPAPQGGEFTAAEFAAINDAGIVVFHGTVTGSDALGVYRWRNGALAAVAVPGTPPAERWRLEHAFYPQIDRNGRVVFVGQTRRGAGLYRWVNGAIRPIVEPGTDLPGIGPMLELEFNGRRPFDLNAPGAVAFIAHGLTRAGVFVWEQGKVKPVALSEAGLPAVGVAVEVGRLSAQASGYGPPGYGAPGYGPPGAPYGSPAPYGYPAAAGTSGAGATRPPGGAPPGPSAPYGPPGRGYGYYGRSFGIGLSDDGKVLFLATVRERTCLVLATPETEPEKSRIARR